MIKILLADDHLLFRTMLEEMLLKDATIEIVASCSNGEEVIKACHKRQPDIAILDIGMPIKSGLETLMELKCNFPDIKVVLLTTFEDDTHIKQAIQLGVNGYLIKDMSPEALLTAIKSIYQNQLVFHPCTSYFLKSIAETYVTASEKKVTVDEMLFDQIEIRILQLMVQGKTNKEIGALLNYSEGTIKNKISKLLSTTGFSDRTELSVFAIKHSLV